MDQQHYSNNQQQYGYPPPPGHLPQYPPPFTKKPNRVMAAIAFACGIYSMTLPVPVIDILLGLTGIILAALAMRSGAKGLAIAGLIVSIVGTLFAIFYTIDVLGLFDYNEFTAMIAGRF